MGVNKKRLIFFLFNDLACGILQHFIINYYICKSCERMMRMLTGMQILVIGGDARQLEVINRLATLDAKITLIGFEQLTVAICGTEKAMLSEIDPAEFDAVLLPVSGVSTLGVVEAVFSDKEIILMENFIAQTKPSCVIYAGIISDYLEGICTRADREVVSLMARDDVAIYNAVPTTEGVLLLAIQNTDITIHDAKVIVLGLGRCGLGLARVLDLLGAHVSVGVRSDEQLARAFEMGLETFHLRELEQKVEDVDICVNTIPHLVLIPSVIAKMPLRALIIDIASKPGGTDFRYADKRGVKAILAPGLPGIVAPKTAGKILANVLSQLLISKNQKRSR